MQGQGKGQGQCERLGRLYRGLEYRVRIRGTRRVRVRSQDSGVKNIRVRVRVRGKIKVNGQELGAKGQGHTVPRDRVQGKGLGQGQEQGSGVRSQESKVRVIHRDWLQRLVTRSQRSG